MNRLTEKQRTVLDLVCCEGKTYQEVADRMGINEQTVKNHTGDIFLRLGLRPMPRVCFEYARRKDDMSTKLKLGPVLQKAVDDAAATLWTGLNGDEKSAQWRFGHVPEEVRSLYVTAAYEIVHELNRNWRFLPYE